MLTWQELFEINENIGLFVFLVSAITYVHGATSKKDCLKYVLGGLWLILLEPIGCGLGWFLAATGLFILHFLNLPWEGKHEK